MTNKPPAVLIENLSGHRVDVRKLAGYLRRAVKFLRIPCGEWRISLVDDNEMGELHKRTMGIPTTTDVLTFDLRDDSTSRCPLDLDTVICRDVAQREAADRGHSTLGELALYAIHSLLHVRGHNDLDPADSARMHAEEDRVLEAIGLGRVYASDGAVSSKQRAQKRN